MPTFELVAHRGYARAYPENTLAAVAGAFAAGAEWVEIDVQLSREGTPHLFHDRTLDRVCGRSGAIAELTDAEIARLGASERPRFGERFADERVPTLAAFVELLLRRPRARAFVEVKPAAVERFGVERSLAAVLEALEPARERCVLISFSIELLAAARESSSMELGPILTSWEQRASPEVVALRPECCFCDVKLLPASGALEAGGARLAVYEVIDPDRARELGARGARYVETMAFAEMRAALERAS